MKQFVETDILSGQQMSRYCAAELFYQTEPERKDVEFLEQICKAMMSFESGNDFVNQSFQLFRSSPLEALK